jgi:hypothetical protein
VAVDLNQLVFGAVLGFASAGGLRWWQYNRDILLKRVEQFDACISELAECASEYWCNAHNSKDKKFSLGFYESRILGQLAKIDGLFVLFSYRLSMSDRKDILKMMNDIHNISTGGSFQSKLKKKEYERALDVQVISSKISVSVHGAIDRALDFTGYFRYLRERGEKMQEDAISGL